MYDLTTYLATKDSPGGPIYIDEQFTAEYQLKNTQYESADAGPPTLGRTIGGVLSLILLIGTGFYLYFSI